MKHLGTVAVILSVLAMLPVMSAVATEKDEQNRPSGYKTETTSIIATVEKIDYETRTVVLKGSKGNFVEMKVGEEAKNLNQVKKGDEVTFIYSESVAIEVQKSKGAPRVFESTSMTRSKPGEKPERTVKTTGIMTATVEEINHQTRVVSLRLPEGNIMKLTVGQQVKRLDEVRKGDEVVVQYLTNLSIVVKKP